MFMLETMIFYKRHYFKEYFSEGEEEEIQLPSRHPLMDNKDDEEWNPRFSNSIVRPEIMLKRDDDVRVFDKNCETIRNGGRRVLEQSDVTNRKNSHTGKSAQILHDNYQKENRVKVKKNSM